MENPFRFGAIVTGKSFADRDDEIHQLVAAFSNSQNVILSSPRRYGKTSLLLETFARLRRRRAQGTILA
jgi:hypothetical protein